MSKITFKSIEIEGFRSVIDPLSFDLSRPGLNLVKGINGAGKTSIFEALVWAVYGINLKDTNIGAIASWPELRTKSWKGTLVSINFYVGKAFYQITRHLDYKGLTYGVKGGDSLMLFKEPGENDDAGNPVQMLNEYRDKAAAQEAINRIVGMDSRTFLSAVLFGQRMKKLVESENKDKRELFETLFETGWVTDAKIKCDANIKELETDIFSIEESIRTANYMIEQKHISLDQAKTMLAGYEESKQKRLHNKVEEGADANDLLIVTQKGLESLQLEAEALKYDPNLHNQVETDYNDTKELMRQAELSATREESQKKQDQAKLGYLKQDVTRAQEELDEEGAVKIEGECPYCAQELKEGNKLELTHKNKIKSCEAKVKLAKTVCETFAKDITQHNYATQVEISSDQLKKRVEDLNKQLLNLNQLEQQYNTAWDKVEKQTRIEEQGKKDIARINKEIDSIKAEQPPKIDIKSIENEIETSKTDLNVLGEAVLDLREKLEIARWWSTKAFGAGGIKAYIFTSMLTQLNQNTKKYGNRLGVSLEFSIDLSKASKPFMTKCSIGDKTDKDYKEFSGGEKQRLDLCLMFAMYDLISAGTDINLLIMDEALEGLDEDGEAAAFDLIRLKAEEGRSVYVITHSATLDSLFSNTINIEKTKQGNTLILK